MITNILVRRPLCVSTHPKCNMHPSTASLAFLRTSTFLSQIFAYKYGKQTVISSFDIVFGGINGIFSANQPHSSIRSAGLPVFNASAIISPSKKSL